MTASDERAVRSHREPVARPDLDPRRPKEAADRLAGTGVRRQGDPVDDHGHPGEGVERRDRAEPGESGRSLVARDGHQGWAGPGRCGDGPGPGHDDEREQPQARIPQEPLDRVMVDLSFLPDPKP